MSTAFDSLIEIYIDESKPDIWDESHGIRLPRDFVVSRNSDGSVASRLGDLRWDWSAYHPTGKSKGSYFSYWINGRKNGKRKMSIVEIPPERVSRVNDIQHLMSLILYKKPGGIIGSDALMKYSSALCQIALYADHHALEVTDVLGNPMHLTTYCHSLTSSKCIEFGAILSFLMALDPIKEIGFHIAGNAVIKEIKTRVRTHVSGHKQTPPIPTRIYSAFIKNLNDELNDFLLIKDKYLNLVLEYFDRARVPNSHGCYDIRAYELIRKYELDHYFEAKGLPKTHSGISRGLTQIQLVCKLTVHVFSGMRNQEADFLPYHCTENERSHGRTHYVLCGQTTKLNKGKIRRTKWVTVDVGHRAVEVAQRIADVIYKICDDTPKKSITLINRYPLFVTTGYLGVTGSKQNHRDNKTIIYQTKALGFNDSGDHSNLKARLLPIIEETDLQELEDIDPHRAWRSETQFQIGLPWTLGTHQLRRSLALYAQRSGLVSLPSLRRQLQHITKEMSLYYTKGSYFARNFIEDDPDDYAKHICKEWREAKPESEALAFIREVVFADEALFGGAGAFEQLKNNRGQISDRETTIRQFRKGVIGYKEIPFGGCIKVGDCDKIGLRLVGVLCLSDCKNIVVKMTKLERIIVRQTNLVESLDPTSATFRMENDDLNAMREARKRWHVTRNETRHD